MNVVPREMLPKEYGGSEESVFVLHGKCTVRKNNAENGILRHFLFFFKTTGKKK